MLKCADCEYCRGYRAYGTGATRVGFHCEHPDREYIGNYFKEKRRCTMEGFIGFSKPYGGVPALKGTPRWCPKKKVEADNEK